MPRNVNGYGVALNGTLYRSGLGTKDWELRCWLSAGFVTSNDMVAIPDWVPICRCLSSTFPLFFRYIHQAGLLADSRTLYFGNLIFCLVARELLHQCESTLQSNTLPASLCVVEVRLFSPRYWNGFCRTVPVFWSKGSQKVNHRHQVDMFRTFFFVGLISNSIVRAQGDHNERAQNADVCITVITNTIDAII